MTLSTGCPYFEKQVITSPAKGLFEKVRKQGYLGEVKFTNVQNNSGVFYGDARLKGWRSRSKGNSEMGRISGDKNSIASYLNWLNDTDFMDMFQSRTTP